MMNLRAQVSTFAVVALCACDGSRGLAPSVVRPGLTAGSAQAADVGSPATATGGGHYALPGVDVQFAFGAVQPPLGAASGQFHVQGDEGGGLLIDIAAAVTCLSVDPVNHRAWIGGVVTRNTSTDPDLQADIHQPGRDIWFRVLDAGEGVGVIDRTSFTGFKGSAGIQTSAEYCAVRLWAPDNARTWPVTGNVTVTP